MFICGSGSFGHQDENESYTSPCSTPKRSKKNTSFCKNGKDNSSKNPYADRGLDKFYALLAELDDKKQKIYTQMGSDQISFVRFVYSNDSKHIKPIVVKNKEKNQENNRQSFVKHQRNISTTTNPVVATVVQKGIPESTTEMIPDQDEKTGIIKNKRHPYYYFPVLLVLILLLLVVYGRSFAILCTSIGWYLIPTGNSLSSSTRKPKRKKEFVRKLSEKKIVNNEGSSSPTSVINGLNEDKSAQQRTTKSIF